MGGQHEWLGLGEINWGRRLLLLCLWAGLIAIFNACIGGEGKAPVHASSGQVTAAGAAPAAGRNSYFCRLRPYMTGLVTLQRGEGRGNLPHRRKAIFLL